MKWDILSFNAQVGFGIGFINKIKFLLILFCVSFINQIAAQEVKPEFTTKPNAIITVAGEAFIYSKDQAFNDQVTKNKQLQKDSKVKFGKANTLIISAKEKKKASKPVSSAKRKVENIVIASKKSASCNAIDLPKKEIVLHITDLDENDKFFAGGSSGNISFISPNNDYNSGKCLALFNERTESISLNFLHNVVYFYHNDNSVLQVFHHELSVRPPPSFI